MNQEDKLEQQRAGFAAVLKNIRETWPMQVEITQLACKKARIRYLALRAEGFDAVDALKLCVQDISI